MRFKKSIPFFYERNLSLHELAVNRNKLLFSHNNKPLHALLKRAVDVRARLFQRHKSSIKLMRAVVSLQLKPNLTPNSRLNRHKITCFLFVLTVKVDDVTDSVTVRPVLYN